MASSLTLADAKDELEKLIKDNQVQYVIDDYIGVVKNNYVLFPNDNHKYRYNRDKLISNILKNKISDHLYTMSPKTLNKKTKKPTNTDTLDVDLKFITVYDDEGKKYGRTWVDKEKFPQFEYDYQDSQDNSSLNLSLIHI